MASTFSNNPPQPLQTSNIEEKKAPSTVMAMLKDPRYQDSLRGAAAGTGVTADRMLRVLTNALQQSPGLKECAPMTLFGAMMASVSLGLEPNNVLGQSYLIPFKISKKDPKTGQFYQVPSVQFILGYKGMITLARRSGQIKTLRGDVVYDGDDFSFEYGSNQHLKHIPKGSREGRKPIWGYAHTTLTDGGEQFEVLPYDEILRVRNSSQGYKSAITSSDKYKKDPVTPWIQHEHEMASKTMIRRLFKFLPVSIEMMRANELDAFGERGIRDYSNMDYSQFATNPDKAFSDLDAGVYSRETGEVIENEEVKETTEEVVADAAAAATKSKPATTRKAAAPKQVEHQPAETMPPLDTGIPSHFDEEQQTVLANTATPATTKQPYSFGDE